jgi:molybdopterin-containing oxidoreductase family iron-sulfur binding subunit
VEGDIAEIRGFAAGRKADKPGSKMNRLYVVENRYTLTGGMSDHRLRLASSRSGAFVKALALQVSKLTGDSALAKAASELKVADTKFKDRWVEECAADLVAHKGASVVLVGQRQPAAVQALGLAVNAARGGVGSTLQVRKTHASPSISIGSLAAELRKGKTTALFILGGNPVFNAPADVRWADAQAAVKTVVHLSLEANETSSAAQWHVPAAHYLEQWGDAVAVDGSHMVVQPVIMPLYNGLSNIELLAKIAGVEGDAHALVQKTFVDAVPSKGDLTAAWAKALKSGYVEGSQTKASEAVLQSEAVAKACAEASAVRVVENTFELVFVTDSKLDDGRYANNGWLQELPDPIT